MEKGLEAECNSCGNTFWPNESFPATVECPECGETVEVPEKG